MISSFREEQQFNQWWIWLILIGIGVLPFWGIYRQIILGKPFGDNPMSDLSLVIFGVMVLGLIAFIGLMRLRTVIDDSGIQMTFYPLVSKKVDWKDVKRIEIVDYGFVGYGIRMWTKYGTVYNTNGSKGLAIELVDGKKFVIGTQKVEEMEEVIKAGKGWIVESDLENV